MTVLDAKSQIDQLRTRILDLIASGELGQAGKLPTERALSNRFRVGRGYVRQALDALEADRLIWRHQGKGTFVGQPADPIGDLAARVAGQTNALEVMEARLCIEPELAALCAKRMQRHEVEALRKQAQQQLEAKDAQAIELWDGALHRHIAQCARNRPLLAAFSMLDKIRCDPDWVSIRAKTRTPSSLEVTHGEHLKVITEIEAGHVEGARTAMKDHLTTRFDALLADFDARPQSEPNADFLRQTLRPAGPT
ncbi:FadR/GntR family transcriptional regulator [uncultured Tateyamaria sp.]|uniref:FadR/GntR family transcriptional regulator n=1 Tax=uncultured Tateyamaria sp. TaxID=455651 RepID=UPI00260EEC5B|nr:FCD domain-containing protein [uncultured Tateyamaria sp.]